MAMVQMHGLLRAKRALAKGEEVMACTHDPMGHGVNFKVIDLRREMGHYYGKDVEQVWYPIGSIVSINGERNSMCGAYNA